MSKPLNVNEVIPRRQRVLGVISKIITLLGLTALGLLLTRPATLPVGWIVFVVAVIQLSLTYSPTEESPTNPWPIPTRSTEFPRYRYRLNGPDEARKASRKAD